MVKPDGREPIPVKWVKFIRALALPGPKDASDSITANYDARKGEPHYHLEYLPWVRHHAITFNDGRDNVRRVLVHETHVASWEQL